MCGLTTHHSPLTGHCSFLNGDTDTDNRVLKRKLPSKAFLALPKLKRPTPTLSLCLYLTPLFLSLDRAFSNLQRPKPVLDRITVIIMAAGLKMVIVALVIISVSLGGKWVGVGAQVHHVVGGDRGWDPSSDVSSWPSGRIFRVGDKICKPLLFSL